MFPSFLSLSSIEQVSDTPVVHRSLSLSLSPQELVPSTTVRRRPGQEQEVSTGGVLSNNQPYLTTNNRCVYYTCTYTALMYDILQCECWIDRSFIYIFFPVQMIRSFLHRVHTEPISVLNIIISCISFSMHYITLTTHKHWCVIVYIMLQVP